MRGEPHDLGLVAAGLKSVFDTRGLMADRHDLTAKSQSKRLVKVEGRCGR